MKEHMIEPVVQSPVEIAVDSMEKSKIRVLHVDAEPAFLKVANQRLRLQGAFQVDTASCVEEAWEKMRKKEYDVVVSDYQMPEKDGLQFLKELREKGNSIPFIVFAGKCRKETAIKALNLGADKYFNKSDPTETVYGELARDIRQIVDKRRAEQSFLKSEDKYRQLVETLREGIWVIDKDSFTTFVNPRMAEILGYPIEGMKGRHLFSFMDGHGVEIARRLLERLKQGIKEQYELEFLRKDGTHIYAALETSSITDDNGNYIGALASVMDITERKKTVESLRESEEKFRNIFESATDVMALVDAAGRFLDVNKKAVEAFGGSKEELVGKHFTRLYLDIMSLTQISEVEKAFAVGLASKESNLDVSVKNKKGQTILLECSASLLKLEDESKCLLVVGKDVTKRRRAEEELARSEARHRTLVEQSLEGIVILEGPEPHLVFANNATSKIFGCTSEEMTSLSPQETTGLVHPEDRDVFFGLFKDQLEGKPTLSHFEFRGIKKDGTAVWLEVSSHGIEFDGHPAVQATFTDITERKRAEDRLRENEERFRNIVENSQDVIMLTQPDGRISYVSPACCKVLGYEAAELVGKQPWTFHPDDLERVKTVYYDALKGRKGSNLEYRVITNTGETRWVSHSWSPVIADNKVKLIVSVVRDITERRNMEETLRKSECRYRSLVEQSTQGIVIAQGPIPHMVFANPAMSMILGYGVEELLSLSPQQAAGLLHPDDRELFFERFKDRLEGKPVPPRYEIRGITKEGNMVWLELSSARTEYEGHSAVQAIFTDITERKKTEESLRESEEKFRNLAEQSPNMIFINQKGTIVYANKKAEETLGYTKEEFYSPTFDFLALIAPESRKSLESSFAKHMRGQAAAPCEYKLSTQQGGTIDAILTTKLTTYGGKPAILCIVADISERKKAEKAVLESEQKLEGLFKGNPEAVVYFGPDLCIKDINPRFEELFGYSLAEIKGKHINDVVTPEDLRGEAENLDKQAKNGYTSHDTVRKRKNGSLVPVSISVAPMNAENKLLGYVGIYKDVTELKRANEESEESRKHFQVLFDLMADPVAVVNGGGEILEVSQKVEEMTGFKKEELVGKSLLKVGMFGAKTKTVMMKKLVETMLGMHEEPYEVEVLRKDGGKLMYEINGARINYKGEPADLVVFRDISERKIFEEKLRAVGSLTRHDVANKLSVVTGNAYLLRRKLAGDSEALEQLADMENAIRNVEATFEFARAYEKLGDEQMVTVNVGEAFDEATSLFSDLKGIRILNECGGLTVLADSFLRQLFHNLIDNSLKYGEKFTQIRICYEKSEDQLKLIYEDDGVGISKDNKAKIFTEGFTTGKGMGYGLFMTKRICDVYGWTIHEAGKSGRGVRFIMTISRRNQ